MRNSTGSASNSKPEYGEFLVPVDGGEKRGQDGGDVAPFSFEPFSLGQRGLFRTVRSSQGRAVVGRGEADP